MKENKGQLKHDDWAFGFPQPLPERKNYPLCPECNSDKVVGICYASTNPSTTGHYGLHERLCAGDGIVSAQHSKQINLSEPIPMWHCHNCEHNFG